VLLPEEFVMMSKEVFHAALRTYLHRQPFVPFVVALHSGDEIVIPAPPVVFSDGVASFIAHDDGRLVEFHYQEVKEFRPATMEVES
jgi:hypothetical protein